ncbi:MAG: hypothetical protein WEA09_08155 [Gemmatimonadota bacterium]
MHDDRHGTHLSSDPELAWWLARSQGNVALSPMERMRLRERILRSADPILDRRRLPEPWWLVAAGWARPSLPLAAAAAVVLLMLAWGGASDGAPGGTAPALALPNLEALLVDAIPAEEMPWFATESVETGTLLQAALEYR